MGLRSLPGSAGLQCSVQSPWLLTMGCCRLHPPATQPGVKWAVGNPQIMIALMTLATRHAVGNCPFVDCTLSLHKMLLQRLLLWFPGAGKLQRCHQIQCMHFCLSMMPTSSSNYERMVLTLTSIMSSAAFELCTRPSVLRGSSRTPSSSPSLDPSAFPVLTRMIRPLPGFGEPNGLPGDCRTPNR